MTILRVEVKIGGANPLTDTPANRNTIFMIASHLGGDNPGHGNLRTIPNLVSTYPVLLNTPRTAAALSVSSYSPAYFSSADLSGRADILGQLCELVDRNYLEVTTEAAPGVPLTRTDLEAYL